MHRMSAKMTRRDALKLGTNAAVSAAVTPLLSAAAAGTGDGHAALGSGSGVSAAPDTASDICFLRAVDMLELMRQKKLSSREIMQAHLKQISRVNSKVNAMVTIVPEEQLMAQAAAADEALAHGKWLNCRSALCRRATAMAW